MIKSFLLENERAYIGASNLFSKLKRLGVPIAPYEIPTPFIFKAEELEFYAESLLNELRGKPKTDEYYEVKRICKGLLKWAENGFICHVM